jgi:hypothetical protein
MRGVEYVAEHALAAPVVAEVCLMEHPWIALAAQRRNKSQVFKALDLL